MILTKNIFSDLKEYFCDKEDPFDLYIRPIMVDGTVYHFTEIDDSCFSKSNFSRVWIEGVNEIGDSAFSKCSSLLKVIINAPIRIIGSNAFSGCYNLKYIDVDPTLEKLGNRAFADCFALKRFEIPERVDQIPPQGFINCTDLVEIEGLSHIKYMDSMAFNNCKSLDISAPLNKIESFGSSVFHFCSSLRDLQIPATRCIMVDTEIFGKTVRIRIEKDPYSNSGIVHYMLDSHR